MALTAPIQNDHKCFVYRHIREDKNVPFYIGIGTRQEKFNSTRRVYQRAFAKDYRGSIWNKITSKTGYTTEIIMDDLTPEQAKAKEIELIKLYGRIDKNEGTLSNLTNGGDGVWGKIYSQESKAKMSASAKRRFLKYPHHNKGKKISEEQRRRHSVVMIGKLAGAKNPNAKKIINTQSGEIYDTTYEAAKRYGIGRTTLSSYLIGRCTNTTPLRELKNGELIQKTVKSKYRKVINTNTGEVFNCAATLARNLGYKPVTFRAWLNGQNKNKVEYKWL